jgi:putative transcriptional regulator
MTTRHHGSRVLREAHETASGWRTAGLISKRRMREFDALCRLEVDDMPAERIRSLRERVQLSQAVFAAVLNASVSTVRQWESGDKRPGGPALKLLSLIERKGLDVLL